MTNSIPNCLCGGGKAGERLRAIDWTAISMGRPEDWPQPLQTAVRIVLGSEFPMMVHWGPDFVTFYNDAYAPSLGAKHPGNLGRPAREWWEELWDELTPIFERVLAGESFHVEDGNYIPHRNGHAREAWFTHSHSPVWGDDGKVAGIFLVVTETTRRVVAERGLQQANENLEVQLAALRASEARLNALVNQAAAGIAQVDPAGRFVFVNDRYCALVGRPREELLRLRLQDLTDPADLARTMVLFQATIAGGPPFEVEKRYLRPDGAVVWVRNSVTGVRDADGRVGSALAVSLDISDRKRADANQAFLLGLSDRLRDLADPAGVVAAGTDALGRHLEANRVGYGEMRSDDATMLIEASYTDGVRPLGGSLTPADFGAPNFACLRQGLTVVCDDVTTDPANDPAAWAAIEARAFVAVPLVRDGRLRAAMFVNHRDPYLWRPDEVALLEDAAVRVWDALERVRAEETNNRYRALIEQSEDFIGMAELSGVALFINESVRRMVGDPPGFDWSRVRIADFFPPEDYAFVERELLERLRQGGQWQGEVSLRHFVTGAAVPIWCKAFPIKDAHGEVVAFATVSRDISDQKRAEAELREANDTLEQRIATALSERETIEEALRQSQKIEAVGQLTGGLAHDFNNLLAGISGSLELLQVRMAQGRTQDAGRYIGAAQDAARRAASLTHRLLAFTRRQTLDPRPTDLNRLVADLADPIHRAMGPRVVVDTVAAAGLWTTLVDPAQLENALMNLCMNARDAMPDGGRLTIETANQRLDEQAARERDLEAGQYVTLCVADTGTGMAANVMKRAFDPFFTTKPIGQGTGLGLSMIHGFTRQSGGQARIRSEPGQGTVVCLYLPRELDEAETVVKFSEAAHTGQGETVLVIDDEPSVRMLVAEVLTDAGYVAIEAADGAAGLAVLRSGVRIDLLVTDVGLPGGMNGRQVADAARVLRRDLKVLFITGYAENAVLGHGQLAPGMHVLTKPFAIEALASRIQELMGA